MQLDGVPRTQTSRGTYYSLTTVTVVEAHGAVACTTTCKGRNYCTPRDPASWQKWPLKMNDCERNATVALPTAASLNSVLYSAALYAFSTVYELPLTRFEIKHTDRQTDRQTDIRTWTITLPRFTLRPREVTMLCICSTRRLNIQTNKQLERQRLYY